MRSLALVLVALLAAPLLAVDELEELLVLKFAAQNQAELVKLRAFVNDNVNKAKDLRDTDADRGIDLLREASLRIDSVRMVPPPERQAMMDLVQPIMQDLRNVSNLKRREKGSMRLDAFREYTQVTAFESRYPGRSNAEGWEPAVFWGPNGKDRSAKLMIVGTNFVRRKYQLQEESVLPAVVPVIQVFGGFYVFDRNAGHHVYLTNREFYDSVWSPLVKDYGLSPDRKPQTPADAARQSDPRRLQTMVDTGEYFMRALPNQEPIPGVGRDESHFLEFVAQTLMHKGLPKQFERIYPLELQERLVGFSKMQMSATKRTLHLLQLKDVAVSPLYADILREEATKVLKSEYPTFVEGEVNRAMQYVFGKLK